MKELTDFEKGLVNVGDDSRILGVMQRALKGEPIKLAFLGGSITQGSVASTPEGCYAYLTYKWWTESFPKAAFTYINAGIGGTTSHLGVGRVEEEVLRHEPDFVIVEFSVNDADTDPHFQETYESLVRRILSAKFAPALLIVHNVRYDDGGNAEAIHGPVGNHYNLPRVSMKPTIYAQVEAGNIKRRDITPDDLHPNDAGHALVAGVITHYLEKERQKLLAGPDEDSIKEKAAVSAASPLPKPLTASAYEKAHRFRNDELKPILCQGFTPDTTEQSCVSDCFKKGWTASELGAKIVFEAEGSNLAVQYRKTVRKPAPIATLTIDGDTAHAVKLDANFDEEWGDCLYLETLTEHGVGGKHRIEIEITETHADDKEVFYLVSLICA
ncbi:MAG: SGNH/GDSL hydrolase family protein [Lachnospiraceae bacterium]|nr:SGNH/GDSL hydrolase family protein [Lachnospiraceae bacterium]